MTGWLRRNRWAFPVIAVLVVLIALTVVRPQWRDSSGYTRPVATVPFGQSAEIGGVSWQLVPVTLPPEAQRDVADRPSSRLVAYAFSRSDDGRAATLGEDFGACLVSVVDADGRQWRTRPALSLFTWTREHGFDTACVTRAATPERSSLLVTAPVAADAKIVAVDVHLAKTVDDEAAMLPDAADSEVTVRFQTG